MERAAIFKENVRRLMARDGLPCSAVTAEVIGVPWHWLRRVVAQGMDRLPRADHVFKLVEYFGLADLQDLWREGLEIGPKPNKEVIFEAKVWGDMVARIVERFGDRDDVGLLKAMILHLTRRYR